MRKFFLRSDALATVRADIAGYLDVHWGALRSYELQSNSPVLNTVQLHEGSDFLSCKLQCPYLQNIHLTSVRILLSHTLCHSVIPFHTTKST